MTVGVHDARPRPIPASWEELPVAEWNIGKAGLDDAPTGVVALAVCEASDQSKMLAAYRAATGLVQVDAGDEPGKDATRLLYDPRRLRLLRPIAVLLTPPQALGRGTGPDTNKPKWLIGGVFVDLLTGRLVVLVVEHNVAGQRGLNKRARVAYAQGLRTVTALAGERGLVVVFIDANTNPSKRAMKPYRRAGFVSNHQALGQIPTHGAHWSPDHIWARLGGSRRRKLRGRFRFYAHRTLPPGRGDHRPLVVTFILKHRPRKKAA